MYGTTSQAPQKTQGTIHANTALRCCSILRVNTVIPYYHSTVQHLEVDPDGALQMFVERVVCEPQHYAVEGEGGERDGGGEVTIDNR